MAIAATIQVMRRWRGRQWPVSNFIYEVALRLDDSRVLTFQLRAYFTSKYFILQQFGCVL